MKYHIDNVGTKGYIIIDEISPTGLLILYKKFYKDRIYLAVDIKATIQVFLYSKTNGKGKVYYTGNSFKDAIRTVQKIRRESK